MTCIVGIAHKGKVYIGGDSAGVSEGFLTSRRDRKVFKNGDYVMGFEVSFRMGQLLAHSLVPPVQEVKDVYTFMVTTFVDEVRDCLKKGGYAQKDSDREKTEGAFLVGYKGRLFCVEGDYQVGEVNEDYHALGSGREIAAGSLWSTPGQPPENRIIAALEAAQFHNTGVRAPFHIETTET